MMRMAGAGRKSVRSNMLLDVTNRSKAIRSARLARRPLGDPGLIAHFRPEIEKRIDQYAGNPHSDPVRGAAE